MNVNIHNSWKVKLENEFEKPYFKDLVEFVKHEYSSGICFPPGSQIFSAFDLCHFEDVKVVIIGQDPYHDNGQANGLCFSVSDAIKHPPSLINIFKEIETDLNIPYPKSGNLERWAKQGVLLLNATLTVRAHQAASHQKKGWEQFTDKIIEISKSKLINEAQHYILTSGHPSPLSANRGYWFGNKHFSRTNSFLKERGEEIEW